MMIASGKDDFLIGDTTFAGILAEAEYCPNCKKIIIDTEKNAR